ncbi:hypothetical protein BBJ28_00009869, partial [Nothophytophthora sp. Chile5]
MLNSHLAKPLRVGLIGGGRIGKVHAQSLLRAGATVSMIADPVGDVAETVAARFGIPRWTRDASELISDPDIDAVVICSPTGHHAEQIIEAARHKKNIFCEKPVDLSAEVVSKAIKAADYAGVKLMVGFNRRFDANFARIKQAIDGDEVGKINMLRITSR